MIRRREHSTARKEGGGSGVLMRVLVGLCVVSSMALVLQLNLTNQHNLLLRNIKGVEEPRVWAGQPARPTCKPQRHLVFLKTHKCASSTLQNVFMRFAATHNLSVVLPLSGVYLDKRGGDVQGLRAKDYISSPFAPPSGKYHFLVHHTRLNVKAIQQLTYDDSVWVTIIREPSAVFESLFHSYQLHEFYGATFDHLVWMLEDLGRTRLKNYNSRYHGRLGRNQMSYDLGLEILDTRMDEVLKQALPLLDDTFHLVMIAERMDESLILLKHLLCWGDDDVVALARNVRKDRYRSYLSQESVATLEHFNAADVKLYAHFKERFEKQVEEFGRGRMEAEVTKMKVYRDKVWRKCGLKEDVHTSKKRGGASKYQQFIINYKVHTNASSSYRAYCESLIRQSTEFTQLLRWKQFTRYHHHPPINPGNLTWRRRWTPKKGNGPKPKPRSRRPSFQSKPRWRRKGGKGEEGGKGEKGGKREKGEDFPTNIQREKWPSTQSADGMMMMNYTSFLPTSGVGASR